MRAQTRKARPIGRLLAMPTLDIVNGPGYLQKTVSHDLMRRKVERLVRVLQVQRHSKTLLHYCCTCRVCLSLVVE